MCVCVCVCDFTILQFHSYRIFLFEKEDKENIPLSRLSSQTRHRVCSRKIWQLSLFRCQTKQDEAKPA